MPAVLGLAPAPALAPALALALALATLLPTRIGVACIKKKIKRRVWGHFLLFYFYIVCFCFWTLCALLLLLLLICLPCCLYYTVIHSSLARAHTHTHSHNINTLFVWLEQIFICGCQYHSIRTVYGTCMVLHCKTCFFKNTYEKLRVLGGIQRADGKTRGGKKVVNRPGKKKTRRKVLYIH